MHQTEPAPDVRRDRPETPAVLAEVIHRAMTKRPAERWSSAAEMLQAMPGE
jgi:hypothetical protein